MKRRYNASALAENTNDAVKISSSQDGNYMLDNQQNYSVNAIDGGTVSTLLALFAGTWEIPGVEEVVITTAGAILIAGAVITAGNWLFDTIVNFFVDKQNSEITEAKANIPERLKDSNGDVKLGEFDKKVTGKTAYKEPGGWTIEKDTAGHGGRKWKLKNKSGDRVASLDGDGKVLSK